MKPKKMLRRVALATILILTAVSPGEAVVITAKPEISLGATYTDNVLLSEVDEESDYVFTVSPAITTDITGRKVGGTLFYNPEQAIYLENNKNDTLRHRGRAGAYALFARNTRFDVYDQFLYTEENFIVGDPSVRRSREPYYTNTAGGTLTHQFGTENNLVFGYRYRVLDNTDPNVEDNEGHEPSVLFSYWFVPNSWKLDTEGSYIRGEYDGPSDDFDRWFGSFRITKRFSRHLDGYIQYRHTVYDYDGDDTEGYKLYNPGLGFRYAFDEDTVLTIGGGYLVRDYEERENRESPVGTGDIGFSKRFKRGLLNVSLNSGYRESFLDSENLGLSVYYGASMRGEYSFTRFTSGNIFASTRVETYDNLIPWLPDREDTTVRAGLGLTVQVYPWMGISAGYLHRILDSNFATNNYRENRVSFNVNFSPERPYRYTF